MRDIVVLYIKKQVLQGFDNVQTFLYFCARVGVALPVPLGTPLPAVVGSVHDGRAAVNKSLCVHCRAYLLHSTTAAEAGPSCLITGHLPPDICPRLGLALRSYCLWLQMGSSG